MKPICWIWLSFSAIFVVLAIYSFHIAASAANEIKPYRRPMDDNPAIHYSAIVGGSGIDAPIKAFTEDFNKYIKDYNKSNKRQNTLAGLGYLVAAITSIVSFFISKGCL
jgi:hypothetical protein